MSIQLNHTIVRSQDPQASAAFLTEVLGLPPARRFAHFHVVETANGVSLDFMQAEKAKIGPEHYAFLVGEAEFDQIFARIKERRIPYYADPQAKEPQQINTRDGGRGFYFPDPDGHFLEILTRPYGSGGQKPS